MWEGLYEWVAVSSPTESMLGSSAYWLRWSGLSLSAWQSHRRFISVSVSVGVGEEGESKIKGMEIDQP